MVTRIEYVLKHPAGLGPVLAAARKRAGLSQRALGERVALTQGRISQVEKGGKLSLDLALQIAREVGLELLVREQDTTSSKAPW